MSRLNYNHLLYFHTVAKTGSVSAASRQLNLTQPTLSTQILQFERVLGIKLLVRDKNRMTLTEEGRHVFFYASEIFDTGRELLNSLGSHHPAGSLKIRIGISHLVPAAVVDALLLFVYRTTPDIEVSVHKHTTEMLQEGLLTHQMDIAVTGSVNLSGMQQDIACRLTAKIPILFCANKLLAAKFKRFPKDLHNAPIIFPTTQGQTHEILQEFFISHAIQPKIVAEIQDVELVRRLVLSGIGIAPLNKITATQAPSREPLAILNPDGKPSVSESIYLLIKKRKKQHPLVQKILSDFHLKT